MFLKKRQNLLTITYILLKSIYRDGKTFVYDRKTEMEEIIHDRIEKKDRPAGYGYSW